MCMPCAPFQQPRSTRSGGSTSQLGGGALGLAPAPLPRAGVGAPVSVLAKTLSSVHALTSSAGPASARSSRPSRPIRMSETSADGPPTLGWICLPAAMLRDMTPLQTRRSSASTASA